MANDTQPSANGFSFRLSGKQAGTLLVMAITVALGLLAGVTGSKVDDANYPAAVEFDALSKLVRENAGAIETNADSIRTDGQDTRNLWDHHQQLETITNKFIDESRALHTICAERFAALEANEKTQDATDSRQDAMISQCIRNSFNNQQRGY